MKECLANNKKKKQSWFTGVIIPAFPSKNWEEPRKISIMTVCTGQYYSNWAPLEHKSAALVLHSLLSWALIVDTQKGCFRETQQAFIGGNKLGNRENSSNRTLWQITVLFLPLSKKKQNSIYPTRKHSLTLTILLIYALSASRFLTYHVQWIFPWLSDSQSVCVPPVIFCQKCAISPQAENLFFPPRNAFLQLVPF
jgi:hypothetical protein